MVQCICVYAIPRVNEQHNQQLPNPLPTGRVAKADSLLAVYMQTMHAEVKIWLTVYV